MPEIGSTLREARMRARIDVSEIEATTKIRAKYLRALENEEWSLLPGPTFVKSFLRTYAQALDLDGKALVEEYRREYERPSEGPLEPIVPGRRQGPPPGRSRRPQSSGASQRYMAAVGVIGAVIVVLVVLIVLNGGGGGSKKQHQTAQHAVTRKPAKRHTTGTSSSKTTVETVTVSIHPTGPVYVCLIGEHGRKLVPGVELQAGEDTPTFRAKRFLLTLGNDAETLYIDGTPRTVAPSSEAIGYAITKAHGRQTLPSNQQPTCT
jgi:cytoskeleton protein RodZ